MTNPYQALVLSEPSLLAYWRLDETSGTSAADSKGLLTGTYQAGVTLNQPGVLGSPCPSFNGSTANGFVSAAAAGLPSGAQPFTLEVWFNTTAANASNFTCLFNIASNSGNTGNNLFVRSDAKSVGHSFWGSNLQATLRQAFNDGDWHHLAATYDGTTRRLYFDGALVAADAITPAVALTAVTIGKGDNSVGAWGGLLDEAAVYNAALSPGQVTNHYAAGYPGQTWAGAYARPPRVSVAPVWSRALLAAFFGPGEGASPAGASDPALGGARPAAGALAWRRGPFGLELNPNTAAGQAGVNYGAVLGGRGEFTLFALARPDTGSADGVIRHLWGGETGGGLNLRVAVQGVGLGMYFQCGADNNSSYNIYTFDPPETVYVPVTARLTASGELSLWWGRRKRASVTTPGAAAPGGNLGLGTSVFTTSRCWSGGVVAGYVWARALSDAEIVALAADPFAPVRPAPVRLGVLSPPSPAFDPVPWLRGAAAAPRAARLSVAPASGWAPGLAAAADLLPWLRRAAAPVPPAPAPRAPLAPWTPASAPAPDPLAWLLRGAYAPPPEAPPLATAQAGWRPELAASFAPAVRHALVRFWRGPEARMPRLEDGEPAWATDTKSLWMGSASGNVRIGP